MHSDAELKAIEIMDKALRGLEDEERLVVLVRLIERFSLEEDIRKLFTEVPEMPLIKEPAVALKEEPLTIASFNSASDIAAFAAPRTIKDRALVIAAFLQVKNEKEELTAYEINKELARGGHRSTNITAALGSLMEKETPLIEELPHSEDTLPEAPSSVKPEGVPKTKGEHTRKRYSVTAEGLRRVEAMLTEFEGE